MDGANECSCSMYLSDDGEAVCGQNMYHLKMVVLCPFKTICINLKLVALSAVKICINLKMCDMCIQIIYQSKDDGSMGDHNMYGTNLKLTALFAVTMYQTKNGMNGPTQHVKI